MLFSVDMAELLLAQESLLLGIVGQRRSVPGIFRLIIIHPPEEFGRTRVEFTITRGGGFRNAD